MGGSNSASKYGQLRYQICWLLDDLVICVFTSTLPCLLLLTEYGSYSYWSLELLSPSPPPSPPPPPWLASVGLVPFRRSLSGRVLPSPASPLAFPGPPALPCPWSPLPNPPLRIPGFPLLLCIWCISVPFHILVIAGIPSAAPVLTVFPLPCIAFLLLPFKLSLSCCLPFLVSYFPLEPISLLVS